jgi:hypothetical protein
MIVRPRPGSTVQVWYRAGVRDFMPWHGRLGVVRIVAPGPGPRNHGVEIDGRLIGVPCGNLRKPQT